MTLRILFFTILLFSGCSQVEQSNVIKLSELIGLDLTDNNHQLYLKEHFKSDEEEYFPYKRIYDDDEFHQFIFEDVKFLEKELTLFGVDFNQYSVTTVNKIPYGITIKGESPSKNYYKFFNEELKKEIGNPDELMSFDDSEKLIWGNRIQSNNSEVITVDNSCYSGFTLTRYDYCIVITLLPNIGYNEVLSHNDNEIPDIISLENLTEDIEGVRLETEETYFGNIIDSTYVIDYRTHLFDFLELHPKYIKTVESDFRIDIQLKDGTDDYFSQVLGEVFPIEYVVEGHYRDRQTKFYVYPLNGFKMILNERRIWIDESYSSGVFTVNELIDSSM